MYGQIFRDLLDGFWPELAAEKKKRIENFYALVLEGNEKQNLTRLTSPQDFLDANVVDVRHLLEQGFLDYPALDLGSGAGIPGILSALIDDRNWVLSESEGRKAEFLLSAVEKLGLDQRVKVSHERAESFLKKSKIESVVARAVGPLERIYGWIRPCSTWNTMVLLKGPKWTEEWESFREGPFSSELKLEGSFHYNVGKDEKKRVIVKLRRVPRGTIPLQGDANKKRS